MAEDTEIIRLVNGRRIETQTVWLQSPISSPRKKALHLGSKYVANHLISSLWTSVPSAVKWVEEYQLFLPLGLLRRNLKVIWKTTVSSNKGRSTCFGVEDLTKTISSFEAKTKQIVF